jgi:predicted membrane protein
MKVIEVNIFLAIYNFILNIFLVIMLIYVGVKKLQEKLKDKKEQKECENQTEAKKLEYEKTLPDFQDPRVQILYNNLISNDELFNPPAGNHWEGWVSRITVRELTDKGYLKK